MVVDDFAPGGSQQDVARLQREAARLIRAQGNRSGRQRMRPDGSLRPIKPPRGLILSTGEDIPIGESIRARMLIVEVRRGDVDTAILSDLQESAAAGTFARALAGFLQHAARDLEGFRSRFKEQRWRLRSAAGAGHARTAWLVADLGAALRLFLQFAKDEGRSTTKALIGSKRRRVLVMEVSILQESGQWGRSGHNGEKPNEFYRLSRHDSHGSATRESGRGIGAAHPDHRDVPKRKRRAESGQKKMVSTKALVASAPIAPIARILSR